MKNTALFSALFCLCLFPGSPLFSQTPNLCPQVVATAGGDATAGGLKFEYTLGEAVIATIDNGATRLTQGFHQPECVSVVGVAESAEAIGLTVFPNPTTGELHLLFAEPVGRVFQLQIFNAAGQPVLALPKSDDWLPISVDCGALPGGAYFWWARGDGGGLLFQVPFVKARD